MNAQLSYSLEVDLEGQVAVNEVFLESVERSETLTNAFHQPQQLWSVGGFMVVRFPSVVENALHPRLRSKRALLVGKERSKKLAFIWAAVVLVLSVGTGVSAGIVTCDLDIGLAVGTSILIVLAAIQGILL